MVSSKPPLRPCCRDCFGKQGDLRSPYEPGRFDRECQQLLWQPWKATSSSIILSSILQFDPSVRSLGSIPRLDPSARSLGSIPQLDPSARSLGSIPRHGLASESVLVEFDRTFLAMDPQDVFFCNSISLIYLQILTKMNAW